MKVPTSLSHPCYHDEEAARIELEAIRWPHGPYCPKCGSLDRVKPTAAPNKVHGGGWYHCQDCRRKFTVRVGSIFHRSHVPLHKWLLAFRLIVAWTDLERVIGEIIWLFVGMQVDEGRIITARLDAKHKIMIFKGFVKWHKKGAERKAFDDALTTILELYDERNLVAHGEWITIMPDNIPGVMSLRSKIPDDISPSDVVVHTMPKERMLKNIRAIRLWEGVMLKFRDQLRAVQGTLPSLPT